MIDFDAEYIDNANKYHSLGLYEKEVAELKKLLDVTSDKFSVSFALMLAGINLGQKDTLGEYLELSKEYAQNSDNFYDIATVLPPDEYKTEISELYQKAISLSPENKFYAKSYLNFAEKIHDASMVKTAWDCMQAYDLSENEQNELEHFKKIYGMLNH